jgi:hypothetical protein
MRTDVARTLRGLAMKYSVTAVLGVLEMLKLVDVRTETSSWMLAAVNRHSIFLACH